MIRKTLTTLSFVGLVVSVGLWLCSYEHFYRYSLTNMLSLRNGACDWIHNPSLGRKPFAATWGAYGFEGTGFATWWRPMFSFNGSGSWQIRIPLWMPFVLFAASSLYFLWTHRHRRKKLGLCLKCGYDLRGSKERCPECGTGFSS